MDEYDTTPEKTQKRVIDNLEGKKLQATKGMNTLKTLRIEYVPVSSITPNDYNPNRQLPEHFNLLLNSIEDDGFTQPVIVNFNNIIVDGEHRWRAAMVLGMEEIPIVRVDMDDVQAKLSTIRHNRAKGTHDVELEVDIFEDLQELGALDLAAVSLGFSDKEMQDLMALLPAPEAFAADEFSVAWEPADLGDEEAELVTVDMLTTEGFIVNNEDASTTMFRAMTKKAIAGYKKLGELSDAEPDYEKKRNLKKGADGVLYKVNLIFTDKQAVLVRQVLGNAPAEKLLSLCTAQLSPERISEIRDKYTYWATEGGDGTSPVERINDV